MDEISTEDGAGARRTTAAAGIALLALLVAGVAAFWYAGGNIKAILPFGLSAEAVAEQIRSWGAFAVVGSLLLMVAHSFVPFPAEFVAIANGMLFGLVMGTAITWAGAMLGAVLSFALARWLGRPFVQAVLSKRHSAAIDEWTQKQGAAVLLFSRFLPVVSFNLINYAAGLTPVSWWTFLWTTGVGIAPLTLLMVLAGEQMISGSWKVALIAIAAGVAISLLACVIARRRSKNGHL